MKTAFAFTASALILTTGTVFAQSEGSPPRTMIAGEIVSLKDLLPNQADSGLQAALASVPSRISTYLEDPMLGQMLEEGRPVIEIFARTWGKPISFGIVNLGSAAKPGTQPYAARFRITTDNAEEAKQLGLSVGQALSMAGLPRPEHSESREGMYDIDMGSMTLTLGPASDSEGHHYDLFLGDMPADDLAFADLPEPLEAGNDPVFRMYVDPDALIQPFTPLLMMASMSQPPGMPPITEQLAEQGFVGDEAMKLEFIVHHLDSGRSLARQRLIGAREFAPALGIGEKPIPRELLKAAPEDTTTFWAMPNLAEYMLDSATEQLNAAGMGFYYEEFMAGFEEVFDASFQEALIEPLGDHAIFYFSDSTGGGSLTSFVAIATLDDPATFNSSLETLFSELNSTIAEQQPSTVFGVRVARTQLGDHTVYRFETPGLPIPFNPVIAIHDDHLVMAVTQQAALAALEQLEDPSRSVLSHREVSDAFALSAGSATVFSYIDSERTMRDGYALTSIVASALENFVTEPDSESAYMVVPTVRTLSEASRPIITTAYWDGNDYIQDQYTSSSVICTASSLLGIGDAAPILGGIGLGTLVGFGAAEAAADFEDVFESFEGDWEEDDHHHHDHEEDEERRPRRAPF
ncbi:MAG: hypothetical protein AAGB34_00675 [Planctomycetota bacterium]